MDNNSGLKLNKPTEAGIASGRRNQIELSLALEKFFSIFVYTCHKQCLGVDCNFFKQHSDLFPFGLPSCTRIELSPIYVIFSYKKISVEKER